MRVDEWDARYRDAGWAAEDLSAAPTPLVVRTAEKLAPGKALDLASGTGRNAIWLAEHHWWVTAVDGAAAAIDILNQRAAERGLKIRTQIADLERLDFPIGTESWDLILVCYYLQRDLFPAVREGLRPGGIAIAIVHLIEPGEETSYKRAAPGELRGFFAGWEILHYYEGRPNDPAHKRAAAEIVARKPRNGCISG